MSDCQCEKWLGYKCNDCLERQADEDRVAVVQGWNWNCSAYECAKEAIDLDWSRDELVTAMTKFGFNQPDIDSVTELYDQLE